MTPAPPDPVSHVEVRSGAYHDSVTLMQISRTVSTQPGVSAALVAMATPLNLQMLSDMDLPAPPDPSPNQLVVAIRASDQGALDDALASLASAFAARAKPSPSGFGAPAASRTISGRRRAGSTRRWRWSPRRAAWPGRMQPTPSTPGST